MSSTEVMPIAYVEANETSLALPDFSPAALSIDEQFPGLAQPDMSDDQIVDALLLASEYLSEYDVDKNDYLTRTVRGETTVQVLEAWGCIVVKKPGVEFLNSRTGEAKQAYGVVFKLKEGNTFKYLGFTSVSCMSFVHRFIMPHPHCRKKMGDWDRPISFSFKEVEASQGHTYSFKLIRATLS